MSEFPATAEEVRTPTPPASDKAGLTPCCAIGLTVALVGAVLIGNLWQTPVMFCANDGSRWNMIRSMFEHGRPWWYGHDQWFSTCDRCTFDKVETEAEKQAARWYSSKPPLFQYVAYGVAWPFVRLLGWDFKQHFGAIGRIVIITLNIVPMMLFLAFFGRFLLRVGATGFAFALSLAAAAAGTYLTAWCLTLNNHVPGAVCAFFALHAVFAALHEEHVRASRFVLGGLMAGLAFTLEAPAAILIPAAGIVLYWRDSKRTLSLFAPAVILPIVAYVVANKVSTGRWLAFQWTFPTFYDPYWRNPNPIDALNDPKVVYLFHLVFGHHGWFLLMPIFLVSVAGFVRNLADRTSPLRVLAAISALISLIVLAFYVKTTNNYGGTTQGPRWLFWLIPMWLMMLPAGAEWFARRAAGRWAAIGMLAVSAFSMAYAMRIPWQRSWIHDILFWNGYVNF